MLAGAGWYSHGRVSSEALTMSSGEYLEFHFGES